MYISKKFVAGLYKLFIGVISFGLWWYLLVTESWTALRLFPTWVLFISAVYYLSSALILALSPQRDPGRNVCPMCEGVIIMGFLLMSGIALASVGYGFAMPELPIWFVLLICILLPILTLLDWLIFVKKGRWQAMAPFYWLALPVCYAATMIFTAELLPNTTYLRYPLEILDYSNFGLFEMFGWMLVAAIIELSVGYVLFLVDFAMSGKLARKIVLPHIRTVIVEETAVSLQPSAKSSSPRLSAKTSASQSTAKPATQQSTAKSTPQLQVAPAKTPEKPKQSTQDTSNPKSDQNSTSNKSKNNPVEIVKVSDKTKTKVKTKVAQINPSEKSPQTSASKQKTDSQKPQKSASAKTVKVQAINTDFSSSPTSKKSTTKAPSSPTTKNDN